MNHDQRKRHKRKRRRDPERRETAHFDSEIGRERPGSGVVGGGAFPGGAQGGLEESGADLKSSLDEELLVKLAGSGVDKALEGEVEGGGRVGEGKEGLEEAVGGGGAGVGAGGEVTGAGALRAKDDRIHGSGSSGVVVRVEIDRARGEGEGEGEGGGESRVPRCGRDGGAHKSWFCGRLMTKGGNLFLPRGRRWYLYIFSLFF